MLSDRMYTKALLGSHVSNYMSCYSTRLSGVAKGIPMKRKHQVAPLVLDIKGFLHAFRGKEEDACVEVDAYYDYCAKRWHTREGTYQLKRRRLLPDVRDLPEQGDAET